MSLWGALKSALATEYGPTILALNESTLSAPQPWLLGALGSGPTATGKVVTPESASRFTAVGACVRVLERSVGQIPCELMRRTKDGGSEPATDHELYEIIRNLPNAEMTGQESREVTMNHLCYRGNAYHQIIRDQAGRVTEIWPLSPDFVQMRRDDTGKLVYDYTPQGGSKEIFQANEVWRIIGETTNGITGISPISKNREAIGLGIAAEEHGAKLFANGAQISTAFEHPGKMTDVAAARLRESLQNRFGGSRNAFKTIVLEEGMKVSKLGMTNVDSQFIDLRKLQIEEICRIFDVPPHKIQHLDRATFNNIEHLTLDFVNSSLMPWLVRFTSTAYRDLLLPKERKRLFFRFDTDSLLQGDKAATANYFNSLITSKVMNRNEVRIKLGMNPVPGGDVFENPNTSSAAPGGKPGEPIPDPQKG